MRAARGRSVAAAAAGAALLAGVVVGTGALERPPSEAESGEQVKAQTPQVMESQPSPSSTGRLPPPLQSQELGDQTEDLLAPHGHEPEDKKAAPAPRLRIARPLDGSDLGPAAERARKEQEQREQASRPGELERIPGLQQGEQDQRRQKPVREERDSCNDSELRAMPCGRSLQPGRA